MNPTPPPAHEAGNLLERLSSQLVPELRVYLQRHRGQVEAKILSGNSDGGAPAAEHYASVVDGLLSSLFHATAAAMHAQKKAGPVGLAAVGSYGRRSPSLFSDLDVRLLAAKDTRRVAPMAEALLYPLWDAGLNIGHQVVTADELISLAAKDLPTATSLLDWRQIVGEPDLSETLLKRAYNTVFSPKRVAGFLERLNESAEQRHERFGDSVFLLEPDIKNGAGGLRDLHIAHWAARARWRVRGLKDLLRLGVIVPREWNDIQAAMMFALRVRNRLHLQLHRRADRLGFEQQEKLAVDLGYGERNVGVEAFMSDYYRHARIIERAREMIVARAKPPARHKPRERSLGNGLKSIDQTLAIEMPDALGDDPVIAMRLYAEAALRGLPVHDSARQLVVRATRSPEFCARLAQDVEAVRLFNRLLTTAQSTTWRGGSVLRELHEVGLLLALIPEFAPLVGRVHHDIYHVYTVDVHSVAAVDRLRALCRGDLAGEFPLACRLAAEIARPRVLFYATLLHDVGKDLGGKQHSERGADMCRSILKRFRLPESEIVEVQHLIRHHLRMYHVATRRDIDDPKTLKEFCSLLHGHEGLRELYLLTVVDVSTTSPTAMTSWKARMLDDLYVAADEWLGSERQPRATRLKNALEAAKGACPPDFDSAYLGRFIESLPERYLVANDPEAIISHARLAHASRDRSSAISVLEVDEPYVELAVIVDDAPGTLARICASFSASRVKVVGAQIYSWAEPNGQRRVLDLFWVRAGADSSTLRKVLPRIQVDLERVVSGQLRPQELIGTSSSEVHWTSRARPRVTSKVNVDHRGASRHTVCEVITRDRRDLLFWLATTISESGFSIDLAKINTEGDRVADVFYLTLPDGSKLTDHTDTEALKQRILAKLAEIEEGPPASDYPPPPSG